MALLKISNLTTEYTIGKGAKKALDNLSFEIPSEKYTLGIVGESGSGKTTLGMSIMNIIEKPGKIVDGTVGYNGKNVLKMDDKELRCYRWQEVSMVYQSAMNSLNPVKNALFPIVEVIQAHTGIPKSEAKRMAMSLLSEVGFDVNRSNAYPHELSGGMRQRVVIALALSLTPKVLIADEPTSALDVVTQRQILALLKDQVANKSLSLVFITHEISILVGLVDNVAVMYTGEIVELGPISKVLYSPLHPYTELLVSNLLTMDTQPEILTKPDGEVPRHSRRSVPVNACKFSNRCRYRFRSVSSRTPTADRGKRWEVRRVPQVLGALGSDPLLGSGNVLLQVSNLTVTFKKESGMFFKTETIVNAVSRSFLQHGAVRGDVAGWRKRLR